MTRPSTDIDALAKDLHRQVDGEVRFDAGARAMYGHDASHYRQSPIGLVVPRSREDVEAAVTVCREHASPILPRGGGTSLAGQCTNGAVVFDFSRHLNRIVEIDPERRLARVEPGVVLDTLRDAAEQYGLTFGPDPSTHASCTLGGMIGNNACGVHSVMAGRTSDNVEDLEVVTADGARFRVGAVDEQSWDRIRGGGDRRAEIVAALRELGEQYGDEVRRRFPAIPRRVSGYNLDELLPEQGFHVARSLVGSEGSCALVLEATLRLIPSPPARVLLVLGYPDVAGAADQVPEILPYGPIGLEGTADFLIENMRRKGLEARGVNLLPAGRGWLMVEFGGESRGEALAQARRLATDLEKGPTPPTMRLVDDPGSIRAVWASREAAVGASARLADGRETWSGWEDAAVPPERLGDYLRAYRSLLDRNGYQATLYGHFGQGCIHSRVDFDLRTRDGVRRYRQFVEEAADLVVGYGGSLSGEHGDGRARGELLPRMFGPNLVDAFRRFRTIWDPEGRLNPGHLTESQRLDEHLRYEPDSARPQLATHFSFADDEGSFAHATARCIGVGKCRREGGGTMCPSWVVTHDEQHTTRGRARLLFEMAEGRLPGGWRDENVKQALDLCLACKGCKRDCPAGVDVATYKAEFLSHYYEGRVRPREAYAFGWIRRWARLASWTPGLANAVARAPGVGRLLKGAAGIAPERDVPGFAPETFRSGFRRRHERRNEGPTVVLWPDTFHDHFRPDVAHAAVAVLESAGFRVEIPEKPLCCGRPLYDHGMLVEAKRRLREATDGLRPLLEGGALLVGLEPSCVAVFRDELPNFFPDDPAARLLKERTRSFAEFLDLEAEGYHPPRRSGRALFHGHCHQKALGGTESDVRLLRAMGLEVDAPDTGCCGMAGSFGFARRHYDVSMRIGERVLLPAVRRAGEDVLLVADGFSCREQIEQATGRRTMHLAEVLA